jgi:predicted transcriptional regulator
LLARSETPSLATTLYITTLTSFGVILSPTLSIFVHLLSMLSIGSLRQEIRQLERENREKDETIRRLEEKIVVLQEQERGLRGEYLWF